MVSHLGNLRRPGRPSKSTITTGGRTVAADTLEGPISLGLQYSNYGKQYGAADERTLEAGSRYAQTLMRDSTIDDAVTVCQQIVGLRSSTLGPEDPASLSDRDAAKEVLFHLRLMHPEIITPG